MLIKVRDYRDKVLKTFEEFMATRATFFDEKNKQKKYFTKYTGYNPEALNVGEFSGGRDLSDESYRYTINNKDYNIFVKLKPATTLSESNYFKSYEINMSHTKDYFYGSCKDADAPDFTDFIRGFKMDLEAALNYKETEDDKAKE